MKLAVPTTAAVVTAASIKSLIKSGAISKGLIQQLVASANVTVFDAIEKWSRWITDVAGSERTSVCHTSYVRMWANQVKVMNKKLGEVTDAHLSVFINEKDGTKLGTKRARLAALRSFFRFCTIRQWVSYDPSREVRIKAKLLTHDQKEPAKKLCFNDNEIRAIDDYLMERIVDLMGQNNTPTTQHRIATAQFWRAATAIGRYAGLRLGDICCLEKSSLREPGKLIVWTEKRQTRVDLPLYDKLAEAIAKIPVSNDKRFCFPEQSRIHSDPVKRSKLSVQFSRILEACKIEDKSFHCLRATLATELHAKGESIEAIAEALGHSSIETTRIYIASPTETTDTTLPR